MKKIIIAVLLTACTTSAFADHAVISFAGKKVTVEYPKFTHQKVG